MAGRRYNNNTFCCDLAVSLLYSKPLPHDFAAAAGAILPGIDHLRYVCYAYCFGYLVGCKVHFHMVVYAHASGLLLILRPFHVTVVYSEALDCFRALPIMLQCGAGRIEARSSSTLSSH